MPDTTATDLGERLASGRRSFSFEFFPPKDDAGEAVLWEAIRRMEPFAPTFVSVTYGAGGSTRDRTTRITSKIAHETTLTPVAHLTCVGASRAELRQVIGGYADGGVAAVLALRGDPPGGPTAPWTPHPDGLDRAVDLVRFLREVSRFPVGVAAFPDGHPEHGDLDRDARVLAAKAEAGASFAITQFFFRPDSYFRLVERVAALGCDIPIIPGIMPVTNIGQIERFAALSGGSVAAHACGPSARRQGRARGRATRRGGDRDGDLPRPPGRWRAGSALLHPQPFDGDARGVRWPGADRGPGVRTAREEDDGR